MLQDQIKKSNEEDVSTHIEIAKAYEKNGSYISIIK